MKDVIVRLRHDERGISILELLIVFIFLGLLSASFALVFSSGIRHSSEIGKQSDLESAFRGALDPMVRELRQAYSGTTSSPIETIVSSGTPLVTFTTPDRDCTGASCAFHLRRVSYRLSGGSFQRAFYTSTDTDGAPWSWPSGSPPSTWVTLVTGVTTITPFTFLDGIGVATSTASSVRTVTVTLTAGTSTTGTSRAVTYSATASLRTSE